MNAHASRQPQKKLPAGQLEKFICQQQLSIRSAVARKARLKATTRRKEARSPAIRNWRFGRTAKKFYKPGFELGANGIVDFVKQLVAHLPKRIRLIIRADSGYFVGALQDLLDRMGHGYLIKVKSKT